LAIGLGISFSQINEHNFQFVNSISMLLSCMWFKSNCEYFIRC